MRLKFNSKQFIFFTFFLAILWLLLILKSVIAPVDIDFIQRLFSGIRAQESVTVVLHNISQSDQNDLRVYRVKQSGNSERVYREDSEYPLFEDTRHYWFGINLSVPVVHYQRLKIEIYVGENKIDLNDFNIEIDTTVDPNLDGYANISIRSIETNESFIPFFRNVINYRGDRYLLFSTLVLAVILSIIAVMLNRFVQITFDSELKVMSVLVLNCLFILKMIFAHLYFSEISNVLFDILVFVIIVLCFFCFKDPSISSASSGEKYIVQKKFNIVVNIYVITFMFLLLTFVFENFFYLVHREATLDEGKYFIRGYWYIKGTLKPYSKLDGNWYAPIYFFLIGIWQVLVEKYILNSLFTIRLFSLFLLIINTSLLCLILYKTTNSIKWMAIGIFLSIAAPFGSLMYNYAHPTVLINTILLLVILLYIYREHVPWLLSAVLFGTLYLILFFTRKNTILIIPWLLMFQIIYSNNRIKEFAATSIISLAILFTIFSLAPPKLAHVMVSLPKISEIIYSTEMLDVNDIPGPKNVQHDSVNNWNKRNLSPFLSFRLRFWSFSNRYYAIYSLLSIFSIFLSERKRKIDFGIAAGVIFIISAVLHAVGATTPGNVFAYIHYAFSLGIIAATDGLRKVSRQFNTATSRNKIVTLILIMHTTIFFSRSVYKEYISPHEASHIRNISNFKSILEKYEVGSEKVLVIDTNHYIAQMAVHFAGYMPEPPSLNLPYSHMKQIHDVQNVIDLEAFAERNWWTNEIMEKWISEDKTIVILYEEDKYAQEWKDELELYLRVSERFYFPYIGWYTIYTRG